MQRSVLGNDHASFCRSIKALLALNALLFFEKEVSGINFTNIYFQYFLDDDKERDPVKFEEITKDSAKIALFFDAMEGVLPEQLQNLEKVLKVLGVDGEFIPGKRTTADFNIANLFVALTTKGLQGGADMLKETPLLKKVCDGLVADSQLGPLIEAAQNVQFFPYAR